MFTCTAPVGQSFSQGMQYQHSSNFMNALFFTRSMASTSSGHTSTQTVQPLSAMHLSSSTTTGAWVRVMAMVMGSPSQLRTELKVCPAKFQSVEDSAEGQAACGGRATRRRWYADFSCS